MILENCKISRLFATTFNVILRRERSELSGESRNIKSIFFKEENSIALRLFSVITGFIPVILVQQVTNLVNKFALLLHKYRFRQACRNRLCVMSGNNGKRQKLSICCHFFKRMYHPGSSANELTLKVKDDYKSVLQSGRSMIEMLGVLAIIAVLSVGGIAGYSKAMEKFKTVKLTHEYSQLIRNLLEYRSSFEKSYTTRGIVNLNKTVVDTGLLPDNWRLPFNNNVYLSDSLNNYLTVAWFCNYLNFCNYSLVIYIGGNKVSYQKKPDTYKRLCKAIYTNVIQPLHNVLITGGGTWAFGVNSPSYYGDAYCDKDHQPCLKDMSVSDINSICNLCDDMGLCHINMSF